MRRGTRTIRNRRRGTGHAPSPATACAGRAARAIARHALVLGIATGTAAALIMMSWFGYRWLTGSDHFAVATIEVRGASQLSDNAVHQRVGIALGDNIFHVDLVRAERAVRKHPWVDRARVTRELPDRIVVELVERSAAALVELGGLYLADASGRVFKRAEIERGEGEGLLLVTGIERTLYNTNPARARAVIRTALAAAQQYASRSNRPALGEVHLGPHGDITLHTYDAALALRLGSAHESGLAPHLAAFDAAWESLTEHERATARVVHLDNEINPDRITVRFGGKH